MKVICKTAPAARRGKNLHLTFGLHDFPAGPLLVAVSDEGLCWLGIGKTAKARLNKDWPGATFTEDNKKTAAIAAKIAKIWPRDPETLGVPLVLYGTDFQLKVWKELLKIKSGKTVTYEDIAHKIGKPKASRAVGSAVGKNPVSIIVPCHRVVNKTGNKVSYGWGPAVKVALLRGENRRVGR